MRVSIVIPVLNEAKHVANAVEKARQAGGDEVIVVDGGSDDGTLQLAAELNCLTVESPSGRGIQMNAGAQHATGDVVLFLHVDTWLVADACQQIHSLFQQNPSAVRGCFRQQIEHPKIIYRLIEWGNRFRAYRMNLPYGDQAMFFKKRFFDQQGGFPNEIFLEDYIFSKKLRDSGQPVFLLDGPLYVSARRWEKNGPLRQTIRNWAICRAHRRGSKPDELEKRYR